MIANRIPRISTVLADRTYTQERRDAIDHDVEWQARRALFDVEMLGRGLVGAVRTQLFSEHLADEGGLE